MSENTTLENSTATDDDDDIITLQEAIQSEQALIADANAVLGACDAKNCTYSQVCIRFSISRSIYCIKCHF